MKLHEQIKAKTGDLSAQIKAARQLQGLSQNKLAEATGLSRNRISAIEKGANITEATAKRIAKALCVTFVIQ